MTKSLKTLGKPQRDVTEWEDQRHSLMTYRQHGFFFFEHSLMTLLILRYFLQFLLNLCGNSHVLSMSIDGNTECQPGTLFLCSTISLLPNFPNCACDRDTKNPECLYLLTQKIQYQKLSQNYNLECGGKCVCCRG